MNYPVLAGLIVAGAVFGFLALSTCLRQDNAEDSTIQEPTDDVGGKSDSI